MNLDISGLYIVSLNNVEPVSVNANDLRIALKCISVDSSNCKFGRARRLDSRARDYARVFGAENVNFHPIAALDEIVLAERLVLQRVAEWRIHGPSGRRNEWLFGITAQEVERIALATLAGAGIAYRHIDQGWE